MCSQGCVNFSEHLFEGGGGPVEGMSALVPLGDELEDSSLEGSQIGEVGGAQALASEDAEPLLDRVHPGTMNWGEVREEARMVGKPLLDQRAVMDRDVVSEQMDGGDRGGDGLVKVRQEREVLDLALAAGGHAVDLAGAGVEGREEVRGAGSLVLVFDLDRSPRLRRSGRHAAWSGLEGGHLVEAEHHLVIGQQAGQQLSDHPHLRGKRRVPGRAWMEPDMRSPGLQAIGCQDALDRLGRDRRHDLVADELPRQLGTVPLAE